MGDEGYVHGYSDREAQRLNDQANTLTDLLHGDVIFSTGTTVLEAGCGVGGQTVILARNNPGSAITSVDISPESLIKARAAVAEQGFKNVTFQQGDIMNLPFPDEAFDHIFVCFVLEHLAEPEPALASLKRVLRKGGTITVIEGDHGSFYCYPETLAVRRVVQCLIDGQAKLGGDGLIGRRLYPLLKKAGYHNVQVSPRMVYVDSSRPHLVEGFSKNTFTAMVEGIRDQALAQNMVTEPEWDEGIAGLYRATEEDGVFCYTFFKAVAIR